jgi:tripartite-type tricarboxylate transporter receptor subunit TctC
MKHPERTMKRSARPSWAARSLLAMAGAGTLLLSQAASAQAYPAKPIRMVLALGGGAEVLARLTAQYAGQALGQTIIVDPQSAAGGSIGANAVARAAPDGYTILYAAVNSQVYHVFLSRNTPYDPVKDFTPITRVGEAILCIAVNPSAPFGTLKDMVAYARRNPGKLSYSTSGVGTTHHLSGELIKQVANIDMVHVPYKGGAQALTDLISGQIPVSFTILATAMPHIKAGKLKLIAVNNTRRYSVIPTVPTVTEELPGYEPPPGWMAIFGPARLPQPITQRLNTELVKALNMPDVRSKAQDIGFVVNTSTPQELAADLRQGLDRAAKIVKTAGIQPE